MEFLKDKIEYYYQKYGHLGFVANDPITVPHAYSDPNDIALAAFFAAIFSWGNRTTIIAKSKDFLDRMDRKPYDFLLNATDNDFKTFLGFKHRTFNETDALFITKRLSQLLKDYKTLENVFLSASGHQTMATMLNAFHRKLFDVDWTSNRTKKHISTPLSGSSCKRLCMFMRWMVRSNKEGIDFGIWQQISTQNLVIPLDIHVMRIAKLWGLLATEKPN